MLTFLAIVYVCILGSFFYFGRGSNFYTTFHAESFFITFVKRLAWAMYILGDFITKSSGHPVRDPL
jgi:hypothetical protein